MREIFDQIYIQSGKNKCWRILDCWQTLNTCRTMVENIMLDISSQNYIKIVSKIGVPKELWASKFRNPLRLKHTTSISPQAGEGGIMQNKNAEPKNICL